MKKVFINQFVEHLAFNKTTEGILAELSQNRYQKGVNLECRIESAQGNPVLAAQITTKFIHQRPDVVVGITTILAQNFIKYAKGGKVPLFLAR